MFKTLLYIFLIGCLVCLFPLWSLLFATFLVLFAKPLLIILVLMMVYRIIKYVLSKD